jgi:putative PIN family toxin of toxin-antitoxin system
MPGTINSPIVVVDTNVLLSALLFRGKPSRLHALWKSRRVTPKANRFIIREYARVLTYDKFKLTVEEISTILNEEILPYFIIVKPESKDIPHIPKDPDDIHFLQAAIDGDADYLISGDAHLLNLNGKYRFSIITPAEFLDKFNEY